MTQTAVEWLFIQLYEKFEMKGDGKEMNAILERAKEIEKEQIAEAFKRGIIHKTEENISSYYSSKKFHKKYF